MLPQSTPAGSNLRQARRLFLEQGELPPGLIDEGLARSWRRSLVAGLAPAGRLPEAPRLTASELERVVERQRELVAHAQPVMEYLHAQVRDSQSMVILAGTGGLLVNVMGDPDFLTRAERVALAPGTSWLEQHRGTNAIGTALAEAVAVEINGAEHYLERNGFLTCAAAPILDPAGQVLGVLDISGDQRTRHPHTLGLVRTAAQMIENSLLTSRYRRGTLLHFHPHAQGIGTIAEGIVALSEDGWILGANRAALALLGLRAADLGATPLFRVLDVRIDELLDRGRGQRDQPQLVNLCGGGRLFVQVRAERAPVSVAAAVSQPPLDALAGLDTGDKRIRAAIDKARRVLAKPIPLLLHGESGVGKELFAQAIHASGPRRERAFIAIDCSALPENLIEAELFGYTAGAFTGARREGSPGRIREAHGGTLFLDEIGDMPLALQCRLLRVLQERQVTPLGGRPAAVDFALICASHHDLRVETEAGRFRADLYYRLNGLTLVLPPLRERGDFAVLAARLLEQAAPGLNLILTPEVASAFADYAWPGNLRQLANVLRTACALLDPEEEEIAWHHLPDDLAEELRCIRRQQTCRAEENTENLKALSRAAISRALETAQGNVSEAARQLGISRNTLYRKLKEAGRL